MSPKTKAQIEQIKKDKRKRILDAAVVQFSTHGYESTSVSQVAKEAGISKGLVYSYFNSKEHILESLLMDVFNMMLDKFEPLKRGSINKEEFRSFINLSFDIVKEDPAYWKLYFTLFTQPFVLDLMMKKLMPKMMQYAQAFIDYYESQGYEEPEVQMRYVSAVIDGIQLHYLVDPVNFPMEKVRKLVLEQFT